jgi:hypothetical protein
MRNLKRALSLGLTATMISGLMVMGSSAASYADVTSEQNQEAIEVLKAVDIMVGDEKGNFNPEAKVTRNEMAVVMSNLMAYNVASYKNTSPFTDVPEWAEPYVAACYTNGITSGYDKVTYGGNDSVTTAQAALMVMKALGYFQYQSDFGADWQLSTVAQGNKIDLFDDVDSGVKEAMTRNDLAQLVLNALESGTVEADDDTIKVENGDTTVTAGKVKYNFITSGKDYAYAINDKLATDNNGEYSKGSIVELGEKLYSGDLTKEDGYDDFGRPATVWDYQAKEIGTFAEKADHTFTAKVTSKALYNEVGKTATDSYKWTVSFNGETVKYDGDKLNANKSDDDKDFFAKATGEDALTGNGVVTEVFVDGTDKTVDVAIIEYYAAEVLKVDEDDKTITLSDLDDGPALTTDEFDSTLFEEDEIVIYSYANGDIQDVYAAEKMEGEVTRVRAVTDDSNGDNFVVGGTTYKYNKTALANRLTTDNVDNDVVAYLDANGYVAYIDESAVTYDYAYVLSMGTDDDQYGKGDNKGTTVYARLVLTDGTMVKVETDVKNGDTSLNNHLVSYTVDKNDVYSLSDRSGAKISTDTDLKIENGVAGMNISFNSKERYTANSNTIFVVADTDEDSYDDYDFTVYTGVKNVPDIDGRAETEVVVATEKDSNVAKVVYIEDADTAGTGEVIFAEANPSAKRVKDTEIGNWYEINAVVDGEIVTLQVKENSTAADKLVKNAKAGIVALKSVTENSDGLITSIKAYGSYNDGDGYIEGVATEKAEKSTVMLKGVTTKDENGHSIADARYAWTDDVVVVRYDYKGDFNISRISSIKDDDDDAYIAVMDGDVITGICVLENDENNNTPELSNDVEVQDVNLQSGVITYYVESGAYTLTDEDIYAILKAEGCTDISVKGGKWNFTTKSGLEKQDVELNKQAVQVYAVTLAYSEEVKALIDAKTISAEIDKEYVAANGSVTVTLKHNSSTFSSTFTATSSDNSESPVTATGNGNKTGKDIQTITISNVNAIKTDITVTISK